MYIYTHIYNIYIHTYIYITQALYSLTLTNISEISCFPAFLNRDVETSQEEKKIFKNNFRVIFSLEGIIKLPSFTDKLEAIKLFNKNNKVSGV